MIKLKKYHFLQSFLLSIIINTKTIRISLFANEEHILISKKTLNLLLDFKN